MKMSLAENPEPHYGSNQIAKIDGTPMFYETFDLDIPMYCIDSAGTAEQEAIYPFHFVKIGKLTHVRIGFPKVIEPIIQVDGSKPWCNQSALDLNKEPVRIPRRFLPAVTTIDNYFVDDPAIGATNIYHHYGHSEFPIAVVSFEDQHEVAIGEIYTVTGRDIAGEVETDKSKLKEYGLIKFIYGWNQASVGPCDFNFSYQTDSATNSIKDGWYSKDVENEPNPAATPPTTEVTSTAYNPVMKKETVDEKRARMLAKRKVVKNVPKKNNLKKSATTPQRKSDSTTQLKSVDKVEELFK